MHQGLGLELRWTLSEGDIILQLVASTGNDRYLALGIREISGLKGINYFRMHNTKGLLFYESRPCGHGTQG